LQEEVFRKREDALKRRDLELQESLIRFSKFLQENDSKRARAEKKAADEIRARQAKEVEIAKLAEVVDALSEEKERADEAVDRRMRCGSGVVRGRVIRFVFRFGWLIGELHSKRRYLRVVAAFRDH
jgi:hypothetical protein